jgi:L-glutamine-phosphate cytidylyltransferase
MRLIVLAAGQGSRLAPLTDDRPKALVPLAGRPLLEWTLDAARAVGIGDVVVVGGHRADRLAGYPVTPIVNRDFATTSMVDTLFCAERCFGDGFVMSYGDIAYRPSVLAAVLASRADIAVAVDRDWRPYWEDRSATPLLDAESLRLRPDGTIASIGARPASLGEVEGQYIGLVAFRGAGVTALKAVYRRAVADALAGRPILRRRAALRELHMTDVLDELARITDRAPEGATGAVPVTAVPIHGQWVEIDTPTDLAAAHTRWSASEPTFASAG